MEASSVLTSVRFLFTLTRAPVSISCAVTALALILVMAALAAARRLRVVPGALGAMSSSFGLLGMVAECEDGGWGMVKHPELSSFGVHSCVVSFSASCCFLSVRQEKMMLF